MKLIIDRSRWIRGKHNIATCSCLLRPEDRHMCCLGFFALACGAKEGDIEDEPEPSSAPDAPWPPWIVDPEHGTTSEADRLVSVNDSALICEETREGEIAEIFSRHGVEVEFVDGPVTP